MTGDIVDTTTGASYPADTLVKLLEYDPLAHLRQRTVCGATWTERTASAFSAAGRTGTYVCTENHGHRGEHIGRLVSTTEGSTR